MPHISIDETKRKIIIKDSFDGNPTKTYDNATLGQSSAHNYEIIVAGRVVDKLPRIGTSTSYEKTTGTL